MARPGGERNCVPGRNATQQAAAGPDVHGRASSAHRSRSDGSAIARRMVEPSDLSPSAFTPSDYRSHSEIVERGESFSKRVALTRRFTLLREELLLQESEVGPRRPQRACARSLHQRPPTQIKPAEVPRSLVFAWGASQTLPAAAQQSDKEQELELARHQAAELRVLMDLTDERDTPTARASAKTPQNALAARTGP